MVEIHLCNVRINSYIKFGSARELGYGYGARAKARALHRCIPNVIGFNFF